MSRVRQLARALRQQEDGVTLIELIIAVAILSIAIVAILSAMGTAIIIADVHKRQATAEAVLGGWAETLKSSGYVPCPDSAQYDYATVMGAAPPATYTAQPPVVTWWDGSSSNPSLFPTTACGADTGLEQVTLTITTARGVSKTTSILKRAT